jgi:pyruvate carboxylase subunit B
VVKAGGAWTSVTPGSQQYWLQAFNNVLHGRWKKIDPGYGRAVLGYFGRPPLPPDPDVIKIAAEQLKLEPFTGDPLEAAPDSLAQAEQALRDRNLPVTDENRFLVAAAIVPGKDIELNEGIRLLTGKAKISLPLKKAPTPPPAAQAPAAATKATPAPTVAAATVLREPVTTSCTVVEGATTRRFRITIEPPVSGPAVATRGVQPGAAASQSRGSSAAVAEATPVFSPFEGKTELVEIRVSAGDVVSEGQVVAAVEAMKAKHDVHAPCAGRVLTIDAQVGTTVEAGMPILTIGG